MANIPATATPAQPGRGLRTRAVFLDALGTLVEMKPPWAGLRSAFPGVAEETLVEAARAEMAYYREHCSEGRDEASLADLRRRCAELLSSRLGREVSVEALVATIRFSAFPDAGPALRSLRSRGVGCVCVSNWDVSLHRVLELCGLAESLDGTLTSAEVGASKPDPAIFEAALRLAGCSAAEALHVGDTAATDLDGAAAAGIRGLLIDRRGGADIASLEEVAAHL